MFYHGEGYMVLPNGTMVENNDALYDAHLVAGSKNRNINGLTNMPVFLYSPIIMYQHSAIWRMEHRLKLKLLQKP